MPRPDPYVPISDLPPVSPRAAAAPDFDTVMDTFYEGLLNLPAQENSAAAWQNSVMDYMEELQDEIELIEQSTLGYRDDAEQAVVDAEDFRDLSETSAAASAASAATAAASALAAQAGVGLPSLVGKALNVLSVLPDEQNVDFIQTSQIALVEETYTANATWTKPDGHVFSIVELVAGGGGGCIDNSGPIGGGGGGSNDVIITEGQLTGITEVAITVGQGGAGYSRLTGASTGPGANGTDSSFGTLATAKAGYGGSRPGGVGQTDPFLFGRSGNGGQAGTYFSSTVVAGGLYDVLAPGPGAGACSGTSTNIVLPGGDTPSGGGGGGTSADLSGVGPGSAGGVSQRHGNGGAGADDTDAEDGEFPGGGGGSVRYGSTIGALAAGNGGDGVVIVRSFVLEAVTTE